VCCVRPSFGPKKRHSVGHRYSGRRVRSANEPCFYNSSCEYFIKLVYCCMTFVFRVSSIFLGQLRVCCLVNLYKMKTILGDFNRISTLCQLSTTNRFWRFYCRRIFGKFDCVLFRFRVVFHNAVSDKILWYCFVTEIRQRMLERDVTVVIIIL